MEIGKSGGWMKVASYAIMKDHRAKNKTRATREIDVEEKGIERHQINFVIISTIGRSTCKPHRQQRHRRNP